MARTTIKSQQIIIDQLSAQVAELTTQVGVLMSQLEASNQARVALQDERDALAVMDCVPQAFQESYATLVDERDSLIIENQRLVESCAAAHKRCEALEAIAAQPSNPKPSAPRNPKPSAPKPQVPAQPIASPEAHKALRVFGALTPQQRSAVVKHAQVKVVNLGNVLEVQAKWHSRKEA